MSAMSLPKSTSSKSKAAFAAHQSTGMDRACFLLQEIESVIASELAETPQLTATYESIVRAKSKRKRGNGPFLIRPINKSKARKTVNDMEFDPVLGIWVGNDEDKKPFAAQPALIINRAKTDKPTINGKMVWDPVERKWKGNEEDLRRFNQRKPPLISNKTGNTILQGRIRVSSRLLKRRRRISILFLDKEGVKNAQCELFFHGVREINGMTFNPITMVWEGNEDVLVDFGSIQDNSPQKDDGFAVGTEFQLSPSTTQLFMECAARHKASTSGWFRDEKNRDHLLVIRTMSIMRVVRDVKRPPVYDDEPYYMDIASEKESPVKSPRMDAETEFDDAWDDLGPFNGTAKIKLREDANPLDIDVELEQELNKEESKEKRFGSVRGKVVVDEDWDDDFEDLSSNLPSKLQSYRPIPQFSNDENVVPPAAPPAAPPADTPPMVATRLVPKDKKKPFELLQSDAPHRRSFHNLQVDFKSLKTAWEDEDEYGLDIPHQPLKLKLPKSSELSAEENILHDDDGEVPVQSPPSAFEDAPQLEEEDWGDVDVPQALGEPVTKRTPLLVRHQPPQEREEWDDFDIPADKLVLKVAQGTQQRQHKPRKGARDVDEDSWDGIDIPDGTPLRLRRMI